ncbi:MAG: glycoside hydrolase family 3 C-terminal domain-containing protein [Candidatus Aminicenantes bacterium]|nr:MAG: glycoside hydrolase family 3 C-terminal domain-containing protein [Candidatus Aminicenantes bacterium]
MMKVLKTSYLILLFFLFILAATCARVVVEPGLTFGPSEAKWVEKTLRKMTLEEKIGQMVACRYSGHFVNRYSDYLEGLESLIVKRKIGGLILFGGEVYETAYLTNTAQKMAKVPLLIASDFERGAGNQISGATLFPPLMALGATWSEEQAYLMGKITAFEGRALGIHMTYSPVVDVNINPENPIINTRSFGEDPEQVSRMAIAFIKGCQENGLLATAKHFPGHGDTSEDSHTVLPTVEGDRSRLDSVELYPFKKAIEAGVQTIMTAHLYLPALDPTPDLPATLSPRIITDLLRKELGFKGLIVTDAMGMGGVTTLYSPEEAALKAVQAGVDILLLPPKPDEVIESLIQVVRGGIILESRIDSSVRKILEAKARLGLHKKKLVDVDFLDRTVATRENLQHADSVFEDSITLVKNEGSVLPLSGEDQKVAVFSMSSDPGGYFAGRNFIREVEERCPEFFHFYADAYTGDEFLQEGIEKAREADVVVFALFSSLRAWKDSVDLDLRHIELVRNAAATDTPVIVISFGSPYFLKHFPEVDSYLCAYRWSPPAQIAAAKALFGEIGIKGKLPVSLPGLFPLGHGLVLPKKEDVPDSFNVLF